MRSLIIIVAFLASTLFSVVMAQPGAFGLNAAGNNIGGAQVPAVLPQNYGIGANYNNGQLQQPVLSTAQVNNLLPINQLQAALNSRVATFGQPTGNIAGATLPVQQQQQFGTGFIPQQQFGAGVIPQQQQFGAAIIPQQQQWGLAQQQFPANAGLVGNIGTAGLLGTAGLAGIGANQFQGIPAQGFGFGQQQVGVPQVGLGGVGLGNVGYPIGNQNLAGQVQIPQLF